MRKLFILLAPATLGFVALLGFVEPGFLWWYLVLLPLVGLGVVDMLQREHAIRRNFPILGNLRYVFESIRPEIMQYFIESNTDGKPFSRERRALVYQRAKGELDTVPFGTQGDVYAPGAEWMTHSLAPKKIEAEPRVLVGEGSAAKPYSMSRLNVSAMSFGALGDTAIRSLNLGAKRGGFAHNTGEGGLSDYHQMGGDIIWQIGTGYFGCRKKDGSFDRDAFRETSRKDAVKMIEVKLSQGAKPGHGGILPAEKLTHEIARIRGVEMGHDVVSPPAHSAFDTPVGLLEFIAELRELSGGKPVGFKLCVGKRHELLAIMKAMVETGLHPDYIAVDGAEGGTGAAPLEFTDSVGEPMTDGLIFVHNALVGVGFRDRVKVIASGKVVTGFDLARAIALGADACYAARPMMMALGCIQARRCNSNDCPAGVATQRSDLTVGLVVEDKAPRVARYHEETIKSFLELVGACGVATPDDLRPWHIERRISLTHIQNYDELFPYLEPGDLIEGHVPETYRLPWERADARSFDARPVTRNRRQRVALATVPS